VSCAMDEDLENLDEDDLKNCNFRDIFRRIRIVGEGAQGRVTLVEHKSSGAWYALKHLFELEASEHEVEVLCRLVHPNITRLYGVWRASGLNILMEYADGGTLADAIKLRGASGEHFSVERVMDWFVQIVSALSFMHSQSVLHRDLKAANVFLTSRNLIKIGDFGISKVLDDTAQLARTAIGTPYYLAPELINGEPYGFKADVWALGVLLYEMMALRRPFQADSLPALAMRIVRVDFPPPPDAFSTEVRELLGAMLQRDPMARPSCHQIAAMPFFRRHQARLHAELRTLSLVVLPSPSPSTVSGLHRAASQDPASGGEHAADLADGQATATAAPAAAAPSIAAAASAALPSEEQNGGGQEARAVACAMRMQCMLTEGSGSSSSTSGSGHWIAGSGLGMGAVPHAVATAPPPEQEASLSIDQALGSAVPSCGSHTHGGAAPCGAQLGGGAAAVNTAAESLEENMRFSHNLHALELNLVVLEQAGESLPDRRARLASRRAVRSPFSSPFSSPLGMNAATSSVTAGAPPSPAPPSPAPLTSPALLTTPPSRSHRDASRTPLAASPREASPLLSPLSESNLSGGISTRRKKSTAIHPPTPPREPAAAVSALSVCREGAFEHGTEG